MRLKATVVLEGTISRSGQFIRGEDGTLFRDNVRVRERWAGIQTLLSTKPLKLESTINDLLQPRPVVPSLGHEPTMGEMMEVNSPGFSLEPHKWKICMFDPDFAF